MAKFPVGGFFREGILGNLGNCVAEKNFVGGELYRVSVAVISREKCSGIVWQEVPGFHAGLKVYRYQL